eukprot:2281318-Pleurochrysis_carterae.AAC.1
MRVLENLGRRALRSCEKAQAHARAQSGRRSRACETLSHRNVCIILTAHSNQCFMVLVSAETGVACLLSVRSARDETATMQKQHAEGNVALSMIKQDPRPVVRSLPEL